jgi:hypothetical protein
MTQKSLIRTNCVFCKKKLLGSERTLLSAYPRRLGRLVKPLTKLPDGSWKSHPSYCCEE